MNETVEDPNSSSDTSIIRKRQVNKNVKFNDTVQFFSINQEHDYADDMMEEIPREHNPRSLSNVCWFFVSILVFYYSDILNVLFFNENQIYRLMAYIALFMIGINLSIGLYMIIWLTHVKKLSSDSWSETHPFLIPIATGSFVFGSILLTIAIWPVYSILSFPILFAIFMGFIIVVLNLPPWF